MLRFGHADFEILLRLTDANTGAVLLPGQFVAAAERFKLGVRLDRYVVERTLGWLERHPDAAANVERCSINLTAAAIEDDEPPQADGRAGASDAPRDPP